MSVPQGPNKGDVPGALIDGRFRVRRSIGRGGMGTVLEVDDLAHQCVRALKLLHWHYADSREVAKRFMREADAVRAIESPHVVQVHEIGRLSDGRMFLLMELLEGSRRTCALKRREASSRRIPRELFIAISNPTIW
jgi:eukaryotic-like serine/threonine-protein kinase